MFSFLSKLLPSPRNQTPRSRHRSILGMEALEDRTVPNVTESFSNGVLLLSNANTATQVTYVNNGGALTLTANTNFTNSGTTTLNTGIAVGSIQKIVELASDATVLTDTNGITAINTFLTGATEYDILLPNIATTDNVDFSGLARSLYTIANVGGTTGDSVKASPTGVTIVQFSPQTAASSINIDTSALTTGAVGLDFRGITAGGVSVNLNSPNVGGYTSQTITATNSAQITAVYGSPGNDTIIGNSQVGNLLIGGGGTDTITGGNGNNEMYSTFDTTPAYGGTVTTVGGVPWVAQPTNASPAINPAQDATLNAQFQAAATANSYTATSITNTLKYSIFDFGSGVSFLNGNGTITSATLMADITNATNFQVATPGVTDLLFAGNGANSIFGFAGVHITANAGSGANVGSAFSTSLSNTWQLGTGNDEYLIAVGDVVNAATNNPTANGSNTLFFVYQSTQPVPTFITFGGLTKNTVTLNASRAQINTGTSATVISGSGDASDVVLLDAASGISPGLNVTHFSNGF